MNFETNKTFVIYVFAALNSGSGGVVFPGVDIKDEPPVKIKKESPSPRPQQPEKSK